MQSGISASTDLHNAFTTLLSTPSQRGILAKIENESLVPLAQIPRSGPFTTDLSALAPLLKPDEAAYILLREDSSSDSAKCVAITYVPDAAPVRQKMLFASTRLTLVRELGTEHFSSTLSATSKSELTAEGWEQQVARGGLAAPLTEEERSLEGIKEAEAAESMGTGMRKGGHVVAGGVRMPVEGGVAGALKGLGSDGGLVILNLNLDTETITLVSTHSASEATPATLSQLISSTKPTYSFYSYQGSILFIYCCPAGCSVKERMIYAASARSVPLVAEQDAGLQVANKMEVSGVDELDEQSVLKEVEPEKPAATAWASTGAGGFARPKRPGRK